MAAPLFPPHPRSLASALLAQAGRTPAAEALRDDAGALDYAGLVEAAWEMACRLAATGVRANGIVQLSGTPRELALAAIGAGWGSQALLPLDPAATAARRARLAELAGPRLCAVAALPPAGSARPSPADGDPDQPALVVATSGSTGLAKAVVLSHANLDAARAACAARLPLAAGDTWLCCLPLHHVGGLSILWRTLACGARVRLSAATPEALAAVLRTEAVTHLSLVPAMLARLIDAGVAPPPTLRAALIGGAALAGPLAARARAAGWPLCISYGMTETAALAATPPPGTAWAPGQVGSPLPGLRARITGDGRLALAGAQVMRGYLNPALSPGEGLDDGWLVTGDRARIDADGSLTILGRADAMLISGGVNIDPQEVETRLAACPGIGDMALTALPDAVWGDVLTVLYTGPGTTDTVLAWTRTHLPPAQRPRRAFRVAALPRGALGKLERAALPALAMAQECPA